MSVAYGAGLRASEVAHLKVTDVDWKRGILHIEQGKGRRDRVDIRVIQVLLGHKKLNNTARYTQVATRALSDVKSPLDALRPPAG